MKTTNLFKSAFYASALAAVTLAGCESKKDEPAPPPEDGGTRWITLAAPQSLPNNDGSMVANGNAGIYVYGITHEQAIDPNFEVDIHGKDKGFRITSPRTSRIQVSEDGKKLWDIQYLGADGGLFSGYSVAGTNKYTYESEVNTEPILGNGARWCKSNDRIGIAVYSSAATEFTGKTLQDAVFKRRVTNFKIVYLDLQNSNMPNTRQFTVALPDGLAEQGYALGRSDIPVVNKAEDKVYITCNIGKIDPKKPSLNNDGNLVWNTNDAANMTMKKTVTLVLDFPTFRNPEFIFSGVAEGNNNSFRTKTQYVATDGHVYQAVCTHGVGHKIVRISSATNKYDDSYDFDLRTALGLNDMNIVGFKYIRDGIGVVLYNREKSDGKKYGAHLALVDLNAKTATKLATELEADEAFYENSMLNMYQNIGSYGDYAYVPLAPPSKDGFLYVINWKTKEITKGAKLKNIPYAFYIGAY